MSLSLQPVLRELGVRDPQEAAAMVTSITLVAGVRAYTQQQHYAEAKRVGATRGKASYRIIEQTLHVESLSPHSTSALAVRLTRGSALCMLMCS